VPFLEKELFLLRELVQPGDVCLDVGAAGGAHLMVMARRAGRRGRVLGVEPRPGSLRALRALVALSGMSARVRLLQLGLADRAGTLPLRIPVVPTRAHFRGSSDDADDVAAFAGLPHRRIDVPVRTLDQVVDTQQLERVDVLKCDVEGAELLVFAGATDVLSRYRPVILVEADDLHQQRYDATAGDVLDAVTAHDYTVHRYRRSRLEPLHGPVAGEDDYVLIPNERVDAIRSRVNG
jgi:FkbM family methyltransferase